MSVFDVAVIGAGAAGIAAARRLAAAGARVAVLEAAPHAGGRAFTDRAPGFAFDHGAHWLHAARENPLVGLAERHGIAFERAPLAPLRATRGGFLDPAATAAREAFAESQWHRIAGATRDVAAEDLIEAGSPWRDAFAGDFAAKMGVSPAGASALDYARYRHPPDDWPVLDGYGALVAALARGLPVTLDCPAQAIEPAGDLLRVETAGGTVEARAAIVTVSAGILAAGHIRLPATLDGAVSGLVAGLPMGQAEKVAFAVERLPVSRLTGLVVDLPGAHQIEFELIPGPVPGVVAIADAQLAVELSAAGADAFQEAALDLLHGLFGQAAFGSAGVPVATQWHRNRFTLGAYSTARPGKALARDGLGELAAEGLFFAGEAVAVPWQGDVHGAFASGERAADAALKCLRPTHSTVE